ncbi:PhoX family phosphatase [Janibacter hoylei]|uniref:PhoX family protein n=1 Tax=Janibacter hoylei TaxID=364298 RepID=UPI002236FF02|nr:PhoX family phosphatase [Janibacter hoylei]MCW4602257.1 PhoX family phosphatase [Janibacter hoylei]
MTPPRNDRTLLPLAAGHRDGGRSAATCLWKCNDACSKPVPNTSDNEYFGDVVAASRRSVLKAGGAAAALAGLTTAAGTALAEPAVAAPGPGKTAPFGFTGIDPVNAGTDEVVVPEGFRWAPIIAWGDPVLAGAPAFDFDHQTAAAQAGQMGYNCDYVGVLRNGSANQAVLVVNNEYTNNELMFHGYTDAASLTDDQVQITMNAHGMTVVEMTRKNANSKWVYTKAAPLNRRITAETPFELVGPVRGSDLVKTSADPAGTTPLGTFGNCAGGTTPWGTILSGEENFNGYFTQPAAPSDDLAGEAAARYGLAGGSAAQHNWDRLDDRFDLTKEPNEAHRHGWIVEVNPFEPDAKPRKLSALGRFKHEGANVVVAGDGRVVVYMGDDERFDYMYKFVSAATYVEGDAAANRTLLDEGDLYVAKFTGNGTGDGLHDGTGEWLPLVVDGESQVDGMSLEEVLVFTRLAADKVGPTKMDRPEDVEVNLVNGRVYAALTNNSKRAPGQVDEANPRAENKHGQVLEITPRSGDHTVTGFDWKLVLICGDPSDPETYFNGYDKSQVSPISCPDNVAFDSSGNLWISTDGNALGHCDGMYLMPLEGEHTGHLQQFLSVPAFSECCGPLIEWDDRVVFAAIQHPGEDDGASTTNVRSRFPYTGNTQPRPAVIMVWPEASNEPKPPKAPKPPKEPKPPKGHKPPKGDTPRGPVIETDRV